MGTTDRDCLAELLSAFLDGEVDERERAYVEQVLKSDLNARALLEELRATSTAIGALPRHAAPASIAEDVSNRLERSDLLSGFTAPPRSVSGRGSGLRAFTVMAAMVGLGIISTLLYYSDWNTLRSKPMGRSAESVAVADRAQVVLDKTNLEHKLQKGVKLATLRSHLFGNETVRLQVFVGDRAERDSLAARLMSRLAKRQVVDLADLGRADRQADEKTTFFFRGRPTVNFKESDQSQILVRVPASTLDELMDVMAAEQNASERIDLTAGGLTFHGSESARKTLRELTGVSSKKESLPVRVEVADRFRSGRLAGASTKSNQFVERALQKKMNEKPGMFDDIMDAIGMPHGLFKQDATTQSWALIESNTQSDKTDRLAKVESDNVVGARSASTPTAKEIATLPKPDVVRKDNDLSLATKGSPAVPKSPLVKGSSGLVARRMRELKSHRVKRLVSIAKANKSKRASQSKVKSVPRRTLAKAAGKLDQNQEDPLVTVVLQLMPRESAKPPVNTTPSAGKNTPITTKVGSKPAHQRKSDKAKNQLKNPFG